MIVATTLTPSHTKRNIQQKCIDSWQPFCKELICVNTLADFDYMPKYNNMHAVIEQNYFSHKLKRYIYLKYILKHAKSIAELHECETICLTNSDIEWVGIQDQLDVIKEKAKQGVVYLNRWEYDKDSSRVEMDNRGYDTFFINIDFVDIFCNSPFVLGLTHFDFWIPYKAIKESLSVFYSNEKLILHQRHKVAYDNNDWRMTGIWLAELEGLKEIGNTKKISDYVQNVITEKSILI